MVIVVGDMIFKRQNYQTGRLVMDGCRQVRVDELMSYLCDLKSSGYTLIGAEQTVNGRSLRHFEFPRKTVLVLGYENPSCLSSSDFFNIVGTRGTQPTPDAVAQEALKLRPTSGWDRFGSLGHPSYFQRLPRHGSVTARQSSSEHQPNFVALMTIIGPHF